MKKSIPDFIKACLEEMRIQAEIDYMNENLNKEEKRENSVFIIAMLLLCGAIYYFTK